MSFLQTLTLVKQSNNPQLSSLERKKRKLVQRISEQIELAKNPSFAPTIKKRVKRDDGTTAVVDVQKRMKRWWKTTANGAVELTLRDGNRVLELAKGKDAIALASKDEVQATLEAISQAVSEGEFDTLLSERLVPISKRNNKQN